MAGFHKRPGHVRPANRAPGRQRRYPLVGYRHSQRRQPSNHARRAIRAAFAQPAEQYLKPVQALIHEVPQNVNLTCLHVAGELHRRPHLHAGLLPRGKGIVHTGRGVVVGYGKQAHAPGCGLGHQRGRIHEPIRRQRVGMEVNSHAARPR